MIAGAAPPCSKAQRVPGGSRGRCGALEPVKDIGHADHRAGVREEQGSADQLGALLDLIAGGTISGKIAKDVFDVVWSEGGDPRTIVEQRGLKQVTDLGAIEKIVDEIIAKNPDKSEQAKAKPTMIGWSGSPSSKATITS